MQMDDYLRFSLKHDLQPVHPENAGEHCLWFLFHGEKLALEKTAEGDYLVLHRLPVELSAAAEDSKNMGRYRHWNCMLATIADPDTLPDSISLVSLRALLGKVDQDHFIIAGRGLQILHFLTEHRFCGKCGSPTIYQGPDLSSTCPDCKLTNFPRISPAVIMSVVKADQILLGRSSHFPPGMYSTLAGFVEPGETLETAVKREVLEEVGLEIGNIRYVSSQPWPFPHSLMIGFSAEYLRGKIRIDRNELEDAAWFSRSELPPLPRKGTIARLLIDNFIQKAASND
jgi:NAD+ diphosphatase